jgi:hypothetical protein
MSSTPSKTIKTEPGEETGGPSGGLERPNSLLIPDRNPLSMSLDSPETPRSVPQTVQIDLRDRHLEYNSRQRKLKLR